MLVRMIEQPPQKLYKSFDEWTLVHEDWKTKGFWARMWAHLTYRK